MGLSIKTRGGGQGGLLMQRQGLETHIHVVNKDSYESRESEKHNVYLFTFTNVYTRRGKRDGVQA